MSLPSQPPAEASGGASSSRGAGSPELARVIEAWLTDREIEWETTDAGYVATLPGERKQKTLCNLIPGRHALRLEAFVMRHPEENAEQLWEFLLTRNARQYGVSFSIDANRDVYLTGRIPSHAITDDEYGTDELDRLLGSVLRYADDAFNVMLSIGYRSAIKREWAWRVDRGESLANLAAFADWAGEPD